MRSHELKRTIGMGKRGEELVMILDIDKVFSAEDLVLVSQVSQA